MQCKTILIVEDNFLIALMLEQMVAELGHLVLGPYSKLNDGYDHARHDMVDFALLDFDLGEGTDTLPIAEVLTTRRIPFAFVSGNDPVEIWRHIAGAKIISKPVTESELDRLLA